MSRERIIELLGLIVIEMGNNLPTPRIGTLMSGEPLIAETEWAYVKGLAAGEVLQLRDRLIGGGM